MGGVESGSSILSSILNGAAAVHIKRSLNSAGQISGGSLEYS